MALPACFSIHRTVLSRPVMPRGAGPRPAARSGTSSGSTRSSRPSARTVRRWRGRGRLRLGKRRSPGKAVPSRARARGNSNPGRKPAAPGRIQQQGTWTHPQRGRRHPAQHNQSQQQRQTQWQPWEQQQQQTGFQWRQRQSQSPLQQEPHQQQQQQTTGQSCFPVGSPVWAVGKEPLACYSQPVVPQPQQAFQTPAAPAQFQFSVLFFLHTHGKAQAK